MTTRTRTTRFATKALTALMAALALLGLTLAMAVIPAKAGGDDVCSGMDSGKIDVGGHHSSLVITAPAGMLIDAYCVKAGSAHHGNGPEYVTVDPAAASVTISHSSGKDISHYSYSLTVAPTYSYAGTGEASATACTLEADSWAFIDFGPISVTGPTVTKGTPWTEEEMSVEDAKAQAEAQTQLAAVMAGYTIDPTGDSCQVTPTPTPTPTESPTPTPTTPTPTPTTPAPTSPETVAPVLPATVEEPVVTEEPVEVAVPLPATVEEPAEPETVSVPLPATVQAPASVPAGDGSSTEHSSTAPLALLVTGMAGLGAAAARLRGRRQEK